MRETAERLQKDCWETAERQLRLRDCWAKYERDSMNKYERDSWETTKRLLRDSWETAEAERLLRDCWETAERLLRDSWETVERQLSMRGTVWLSMRKTAERLQKDCWETAERQLKRRDCWETAERQLRDSWEAFVKHLWRQLEDLSKNHKDWVKNSQISRTHRHTDTQTHRQTEWLPEILVGAKKSCLVVGGPTYYRPYLRIISEVWRWTWAWPWAWQLYLKRVKTFEQLFRERSLHEEWISNFSSFLSTMYKML